MTQATKPTAPNLYRNIYLAYDGSINADWVSRYAIRIAANLESRRITLLHIPDDNYPLEGIRLKIKAIEGECCFHDINLESEIVPRQGNVLGTLVRTIPPGPENFCICGARIASRGRGFLKGTISEKLLRVKKFNVLAMRVVQPGLLGWADDLLFPLAGHPRGFWAAMPFFQLLAPDIKKLYLLRIVQVNQLALHYMSPQKSRGLYRKGIRYVQQVEEEIRQQIGERGIQVDSRVVLSPAWPQQILIHASELRTRLILLGASDRRFPFRLLQSARIEEILRKTPCDVAIYRKV